MRLEEMKETLIQILTFNPYSGLMHLCIPSAVKNYLTLPPTAKQFPLRGLTTLDRTKGPEEDSVTDDPKDKSITEYLKEDPITEHPREPYN